LIARALDDIQFANIAATHLRILLRREKTMLAVGHLAIGYITSKAARRALKTKINLPLIFLLSLIPDVDLLWPAHVHRGPTHSIVIATLIFLPAFVKYRKTSIPYFVALVQHSLIGDLFAGDGAKLLWPITNSWYGQGLSMTSPEAILLEWLCFGSALIILTLSHDIRVLLKPDKANLLLTIPAGAIFLSAILGIGYRAPMALLIPHLVFLTLFALSILSFLRRSVFKT